MGVFAIYGKKIRLFEKVANPKDFLITGGMNYQSRTLKSSRRLLIIQVSIRQIPQHDT